LEAFSSKLRDETDLAVLRDDLVSVVRRDDVARSPHSVATRRDGTRGQATILAAAFGPKVNV